MSKVGQHIIEVEEFVSALPANFGRSAILAAVHKQYGFFGQSIAKEFLDRMDGLEPDYEPV